ncbi:hypothetical protein CHU92_02285 [Flavobacterium cyanobacteriorum]|uniref:Uncharacterized protein n=1 Tax=Flavobacterium cyanobacteriorum TaxID=2022802 RepID=A0A255ZTZ1_9FLAO|nr:DUF6252 family protein [Flavobacterium cyanobacteriorum]OYQ44872.1 hypothetical protein CHU92_02285 [Flavobacterium cyanobacteriorum]
MKKILSLIVLLVAFASCEEDVKFNTPAVQAFKDNEVWRATNFSATRSASNNSLTINATNGFETLTLRTISVNPGSYNLGLDELNKATFRLEADGIIRTYETGTDEDEGLIIISNRPRDTDLQRGFISGEFYFNATNETGQRVSFFEGNFYKVPIQVIP